MKVPIDLCKELLCMTSDLHRSLSSYMFCAPQDNKEKQKEYPE